MPASPRPCPECGGTSTPACSAARWAHLHGPPEVKLHVAVGPAIGVSAIAPVVLAVRSGKRSSALFALLGLVTAASAGIFGAAFLAYRQDDIYSLLMAVGFLGSLFSYWIGLYPAEQHRGQHPSAPASRSGRRSWPLLAPAGGPVARRRQDRCLRTPLK